MRGEDIKRKDIKREKYCERRKLRGKKIERG